MRPGIAGRLVACLTFGTAGAAFCAAAPLRWPAGLSELYAGEVRINMTRARYAVVCQPQHRPGLSKVLSRQGWHATSRFTNLVGPSGGVMLRAFEREDGLLLTVVPGDNEEWAVIAVLAGRPAWAGAAGEAPGREPLGLPRFGGARRILHLEGRGFEAACYQARVLPRALVAEAAFRLTALGWAVTPGVAAGLLASRAKTPPIAVVAEPSELGSTFLVLAGTLAP